MKRVTRGLNTRYLISKKAFETKRLQFSFKTPVWELIFKLKRDGDIYEPKEGLLKKI